MKSYAPDGQILQFYIKIRDGGKVKKDSVELANQGIETILNTWKDGNKPITQMLEGLEIRNCSEKKTYRQENKGSPCEAMSHRTSTIP